MSNVRQICSKHYTPLQQMRVRKTENQENRYRTKNTGLCLRTRTGYE